MRHTAASWLVIDGVPLYDVQALLGHEATEQLSGTPTSRRRARPGTQVVGFAGSWRTCGARARILSL